MSGTDPVQREVAALSPLDLQALRMAWRERFGGPPRLRSVDLLRRLLAWKIQAEAFGGLDAESLKTICHRAQAPRRKAALEAGVRLVREWKGERHEALILEDGAVSYRGQRHASLSEVARAITGARWNGPRFFGLRGGG